MWLGKQHVVLREEAGFWSQTPECENLICCITEPLRLNFHHTRLFGCSRKMPEIMHIRYSIRFIKVAPSSPLGHDGNRQGNLISRKAPGHWHPPKEANHQQNANNVIKGLGII